MSAPEPGPLAPLLAVLPAVVSLKPSKVPIDPRTGLPTSALQPTAWHPFADAVAHVERLGKDRHGVGLVLTGGVTVIDIDGALQADGTWSPLALELIAALPGAVTEVSQSGRGLHIWCRYRNPPPHSSKNTALRVEAYSHSRFIMLGSGAVGTLAEQCDALPGVLARYFPPAAAAVDDDDHGGGPCPEWVGPPDTDEGNAELIRRALSSRGAGVMFGGAHP